MRKPLIAGNWKMNLDRDASIDLASAIASESDRFMNIDITLCPPSVYLDAVSQTLAGKPVSLGAQNVYHEVSGAFTGEISVSMLQDLNCNYVILGHSERRHVLGESDGDINRKLHSALAAGLTSIVCVGELLDQRESAQTQQVIHQQFSGSLADVTEAEMSRIVIAYEPVWAIGTGKVATPEQAEEVHVDLRNLVQQRYNADVAAAVRILYGGSVKPDNVANLVACDNIDGALVGGASLEASDFLSILAAAEEESRRGQ